MDSERFVLEDAADTDTEELLLLSSLMDFLSIVFSCQTNLGCVPSLIVIQGLSSGLRFTDSLFA